MWKLLAEEEGASETAEVVTVQGIVPRVSTPFFGEAGDDESVSCVADDEGLEEQQEELMEEVDDGDSMVTLLCLFQKSSSFSVIGKRD